jgi:hypothetical protein
VISIARVPSWNWRLQCPLNDAPVDGLIVEESVSDERIAHEIAVNLTALRVHRS